MDWTGSFMVSEVQEALCGLDVLHEIVLWRSLPGVWQYAIERR